MTCLHERCSAMLTLSAPARRTALAHLICDDCGEQLGKLERQSADATADSGRAPLLSTQP